MSNISVVGTTEKANNRELILLVISDQKGDVLGLKGESQQVMLSNRLKIAQISD